MSIWLTSSSKSSPSPELKYPPSATFVCLELGIMALLLSLTFRASARSRGQLSETGLLAPLRLLGQTALFYYLLHIHLSIGAAVLLGVHAKLGLWSAYAGAAAVLLLYPACVRYRRFKSEHPRSFAQYI